MSTPAQTNPASVTLLTVQVGSITGIAVRFLFFLWLAQPKPDEESNINTGYQLMVPASVLLLHLALKLARTRRIKFSGGQPIHGSLGMTTFLHGILSTSNVSSSVLFFVYLCIPVLILYLQIKISYNSNKLPDLSISREGAPLLTSSPPSSNSNSHVNTTLLDSPTSVVNATPLGQPPSLPSRNIIGRYACYGFIASFFTTALAAGLEGILRANGVHLLARIAITTTIVIFSGVVSAKWISGKLANARVKYRNPPIEIYVTAPVLAGIFSAAGLITTAIGHIVNNMMLQFLGTYVAATATTLVSIQNPRDTNLQELQIPTCSRSPSL